LTIYPGRNALRVNCRTEAAKLDAQHQDAEDEQDAQHQDAQDEQDA
jgi:hypothetical protein